MVKITVCFVLVHAFVGSCVCYNYPSRLYLPVPSYPKIPEVENPVDFEDFLVSCLRLSHLHTNLKERIFSCFIQQFQTGKAYYTLREYNFREQLFWYRKHYSQISNDYAQKNFRTFATALNAYSDLTLHELFVKLSGYKNTYSTYLPKYS